MLLNGHSLGAYSMPRSILGTWGHMGGSPGLAEARKAPTKTIWIKSQGSKYLLPCIKLMLHPSVYDLGQVILSL